MPKQTEKRQPEGIRLMKEKYGCPKMEQTTQNTPTDNVKIEKPEEKTTEQDDETNIDQTRRDIRTNDDYENQENQRATQANEDADREEHKTIPKQKQEKGLTEEQGVIKENDQMGHQKERKEKITINVRKRMISVSKQTKEPQTQNWWPKEVNKEEGTARQETADEIKASLGNQNIHYYAKAWL